MNTAQIMYCQRACGLDQVDKRFTLLTAHATSRLLHSAASVSNRTGILRVHAYDQAKQLKQYRSLLQSYGTRSIKHIR